MKRVRIGAYVMGISLFVGVALAAPGCAPDSGSGTAAGEARPDRGATVGATLPSLDLHVLGGTGSVRDGRVNLQTIFPADRPVVMWFWAPH